MTKRSSGFQSAQDFLQKQILQQEKRLAEAENRLADFKRRNIDNLPTQEGSYVGSLQAEMAELQKLKSEQGVLNSQRQQLTRSLRPKNSTSRAARCPPPRAARRPRAAANSMR